MDFEIDDFPATLDGFERAMGELRKSLADTALPRNVRYNVEVVFEEVVTNVVRHGGGAGAARVDFAMSVGTEAVVLVFTDDAIAFNPCEYPEPDFFTTLANAKLGGLGILLVRKASVGMTYERTPQHQNRLTVTIAVRPEAQASAAITRP